MIKNYKKFIKDIGLIGISNLLSNFKSLLIIALLTKGLGSVDYGVWTQFRVTLLLLTPFVTLGAQNSVVRFLAGQKNKKNIQEDFYSNLSMALLGGIIFGLFFYIFSSTLSLWIFRSRNYEIIVKIFSTILILESINLVLLEYFKAFRYIGTYFTTLLFETILELGLIAYSVFNGYGIIGAIVSLLINRGIFILTRYWRIFKDIGLGLPKLITLKKNIAFGLPLAFSSTFFFVLNSGDRYVINYFLGLKYVSLYSVAYSLAYIIILVTAPIGYILYPTLSDFCDNKNYNDALLYIKYSTKYLLIIGISVAFGILALCKGLILLFSTEEFLGVAKFMPLLLAGLLIFQAGIINEYITIVFNRPRQIMLLHLVLAIINIGLNIIAVPALGIMGAALTTLVTFIGFTAFNIVYSRRFLKYTLDFLLIGKSIIAAIIMSIVISLFKSDSLLRISFLTLLGASIYFGVLYFLNVFENKEVVFFKNLFLPLKEKIQSLY